MTTLYFVAFAKLYNMLLDRHLTELGALLIVGGIYDVLDKWGLDGAKDLGVYSKSDLEKIALDIEMCYIGLTPKHELRRGHVGITDSVAYMESDRNPSTLAIPLLTFEQLWLPDPLFSFLSYQSIDAWKMMPDAGTTYFTSKPTVHTQWTNYWITNKSSRADRLKTALPPILKKLHDVRPLVEDGSVYLYPWELLVGRNHKQMREAVFTLRDQRSSNTSYTATVKINIIWAYVWER